jgi:hypothetical protein
MSHSDVNVSTLVLSDSHHKETFKIAREASLLEVMQEGARRASTTLLPTNDGPLDLLHNLRKHDEVGPPIDPLSQSVGTFLEIQGNTNDFGIELVRVIKVNNRSRVAPEASMTPRQILDLFQLKIEEYSLYRENSTDLLPVDTAIALKRGDVFEAQKDGKYGRTNCRVP